jgi:hypothetical protein
MPINGCVSAGHADTRTTKLYDRRAEKLSLRMWSGFAIDITKQSFGWVHTSLQQREEPSPGRLFPR